MTVEKLDTTKRSNLTAARGIAKLLLPTEEVIDRSIVAGSQLLQQITQARIDTGASASTGHEAMRSAVEGLAKLIEARGKIVECHAELTTVRDSLNLRAEDVGCTYNSAPSMAIRTERLRQAS